MLLSLQRLRRTNLDLQNLHHLSQQQLDSTAPATEEVRDNKPRDREREKERKRGREKERERETDRERETEIER